MVEVLVCLEAIVLVVLTVMVARLLREVGAMRDELRRHTDDGGNAREEFRGRAPAPPAGPVGTPELQPQPHRANQSDARSAAAVRQTPPAQNDHQPVPKGLSTSGPRPPQGAMDRRTTAATSVPGPQTNRPDPTLERPADESASGSNEGFERIVGGRVLGILAAMLVFFGLVLLAALIVPALTNEVRCAAMFALSAALTVAGLLVARRGKTAFSQTLLGCGIGSTFISILLSHALFGIIGQLPAICLMLVWLVACTLLAGRQGSPALFVIVQLGMAISTCFAYSKGIEPQSLPVLLAYQLLATGIVVAGCARSLGRAKMSGAFCGMAVSILTSLQVLTSPVRLTVSDPGPFAVVTAAQYLLVTCLALVVCMGLGHDEGQVSGSAMAQHIGAELCWAAALCLDVCGAGVRTISSAGMIHPVTWATLISLACVAVHWVVRLAFARSGRLGQRLVFATSHICAVLCAVLLLWRAMGAHPTGAAHLFAVAIALSASGAFIRDKRLHEAAVAYLALDATFMVIWGYDSLNRFFGAPLSVLYVVLLDTLLALWWRMLADGRRESVRGTVLLCGVVVTELSLKPALGVLGPQFATVAASACAATIVLALSSINLSARLRLSPVVSIALLVNELVTVAACCAFVILPGPRAFLDGTFVEPVLAIYTTLVTLGIAAARIGRLMERESNSPAWQQVVAGGMLTAVLACAASGIASANMLFVATLAAMSAAFCCILCGFVRRLGALRLFGLVVTLLCVLKIVTLDVGGTDPIGRVVAFILGGIACFAISALYTYALRRIS